MKLTRSRVLPQYPQTAHLPLRPNAGPDDVVAESSEAAVVFQTDQLFIEEKLDGSSVGITIFDDHPLIRGREKFLRKGCTRKGAAAMQFRPVWNWFEQNRDRFEFLISGNPYSIYGEWMLAQHGIHYTRLPDWFIAYDIYDHQLGRFLAPEIARAKLQEAGFAVPNLLFNGKISGSEALLNLASSPADWADEPTEGIYLKISDGAKVTHRFKMVRSDFEPGRLWNDQTIRRNTVVST